jgi:hypothetical protein
MNRLNKNNLNKNSLQKISKIVKNKKTGKNSARRIRIHLNNNLAHMFKASKVTITIYRLK